MYFLTRFAGILFFVLFLSNGCKCSKCDIDGVWVYEKNPTMEMSFCDAIFSQYEDKPCGFKMSMPYYLQDSSYYNICFQEMFECTYNCDICSMGDKRGLDYYDAPVHSWSAKYPDKHTNCYKYTISEDCNTLSIENAGFNGNLLFRSTCNGIWGSWWIFCAIGAGVIVLILIIVLGVGIFIRRRYSWWKHRFLENPPYQEL